MKQKLIYIFAFIFIFVGVFIRLYHLSSLPPSLYSDEVDIANQARAFNQCRTDYFGNKLPTRFHSFSDWQPPLYIYSVAVCQKIFGVGEFSTRLPSALFGTLSLLAVFILLKQILNPASALLGVIFLTFNPWHLHFSRISFAATGQFLFFTLSLYFLYRFISSKNFISFLLFLLSGLLQIYLYSTAPVTLATTLLIVLILWGKNIQNLGIKKLAFGSLLCLFVLSPFIKDTLLGNSSYRFKYISIFTDPTIPQQVDINRQVDSKNIFGDAIGLSPSLYSSLIHNKYKSIADSFLSNYIKAFSAEFLLLTGDTNLRQGFSNQGMLMPIEFLFILIGLIVAIKLPSKSSSFFLSLLLTIPLASSLTRDSNSAHATRLFLMLLPFAYFFSLGTGYLFQSRRWLIPVVVCFYTISFALFWHNYQNHYPHLSAPAWDTGIKEAVLASAQFPSLAYYYSSSVQQQLPFYLLWHPSAQNNLCSLSSDLSQVNSPGFNGLGLGNHYFGHIEWNAMLNDANVDQYLFIIPSSEYPTLVDQVNQNYSKTKINIKQKISPPWDQSLDYFIIATGK